MALTIAKVKDANIYVNGTSTHGQAQEVNLPEINFEKSEYKALGLQGVLTYFNGIGKMEATIKWNYPNNEVQIACANPIKAVSLMLRSEKCVFTNGSLSKSEPIVIYLKGTSSTHPLGSFKPKDDVDLTSKLDIFYIKQEVNGREICEIDIANNIFRIDGTDIFAAYKKNLGI